MLTYNDALKTVQECSDRAVTLTKDRYQLTESQALLVLGLTAIAQANAQAALAMATMAGA